MPSLTEVASVSADQYVHLRTEARPPDQQKPRHAGLSQCAREDSNLHGPFSPQGPQPESPRVDGFSGVRGPQIGGFSRRIGPRGKSGCCHECCHGSRRLVSPGAGRTRVVERRERRPRRRPHRRAGRRPAIAIWTTYLGAEEASLARDPPPARTSTSRARGCRVTSSAHGLAGAGGLWSSAAVGASARGLLTIATPMITTTMPTVAEGPGSAPWAASMRTATTGTRNVQA